MFLLQGTLVADQWTSSNNLSISLRIFFTISQNCLELVLKHLHSLLFECTPIFINVNYLESLFPSLSFCLRFTSCKFTSCEIYFMYFMSGECTICSTLFLPIKLDFSFRWFLFCNFFPNLTPINDILQKNNPILSIFIGHKNITSFLNRVKSNS